MLCKLLKIFCELAKQSGKNMLRIEFINQATPHLIVLPMDYK